MATTDIYHVSGGLKGRKSVMFLGGDVDDYVQVNASGAALVAGNYTTGAITAWVNIPDVTGTYTIIGYGDDNVVEFIELNIEAGLLTCRSTDATVAQFVTQADAIHFTPHCWHHVAVVQRADGSGVHLYVDGLEIARTHDTTTDLDSWFAETDGIDTGRIGAANKAGNASVTQEFKGAISDVKVFTDSLTDAQVLDDYNEVPNTTNLLNHWDFNEDYNDNGSGADNGTAVGDILLSNNYCEFTSRLRYSTGVPVVADSVICFADEGTGHAVVIQAA